MTHAWSICTIHHFPEKAFFEVVIYTAFLKMVSITITTCSVLFKILSVTYSNISDTMCCSCTFLDLDKLGGLLPVIQELNNANEEIRTTSAWVLGTASQNNELVQNQVIAFTMQDCILIPLLWCLYSENVDHYSLSCTSLVSTFFLRMPNLQVLICLVGCQTLLCQILAMPSFLGGVFGSLPLLWLAACHNLPPVIGMFFG